MGSVVVLLTAILSSFAYVLIAVAMVTDDIDNANRWERRWRSLPRVQAWDDWWVRHRGMEQ